MSLREVNGIYQGILVCSIMNIDEVTDYLNEIKENAKIDEEEKSAYFYLRNDGRVITQPIDGKLSIMCNGLSEEVAKKLEGLAK